MSVFSACSSYQNSSLVYISINANIWSVCHYCHYWQWPLLINCVMCYYLCVLKWLMRPIFALNCLLQIEQERSEEETSVGDALALAFRCACFCSALLILFASYSPAPLFMRPRYFVQSCAICSHDSVGMLKSLREALISTIAYVAKVGLTLV